jgi:hypothetical protein
LQRPAVAGPGRIGATSARNERAQEEAGCALGPGATGDARGPRAAGDAPQPGAAGGGADFRSAQYAYALNP